MKIYHTETQEDYDALMIELKAKGIDTLPKEYWPIFKTETTVVIRARSGEKYSWEKRTTYGNLSRVRSSYDIPIIKYKAKADEKMRFTKENVGKILDEWVTENTYLSAKGIIANIEELDDAPKKVIAPKFVAEWIERNKESEVSLQIMLKCYQNYYYNMNRKCQTDEEKAVQWYVDNPYKFIQAYEDGYTIEPEQLYYIPLPHLETSDGIQQVLSKRKNDTHYFASRPAETLKQRYTKEELEQVPEIYKFYAKPIEEETE